MYKFIFYVINNVIKWKYNYFLFCYYYYESKKLECQEKNKEKIIRIKKKKTKIVNVDNNEENVYAKIILQDAEHDDNIDLDGVD